MKGCVDAFVSVIHVLSVFISIKAKLKKHKHISFLVFSKEVNRREKAGQRGNGLAK